MAFFLNIEEQVTAMPKFQPRRAVLASNAAALALDVRRRLDEGP